VAGPKGIPGEALREVGEVEFKKIDNVVVITVGELFDAVVAREFKNKVSELVKNSSVNFVVDMANCKLIDSSGCGALVASLRIVEKSKGDIKIARPSPQARDLFELTRLHRILDMFDDLDAAVRSFS
jgi:anti-sigma B factor antagonist